MTYRPLQITPGELPASTTGLRREVRGFLNQTSFQPRCDSWFSGFDPSFSRQLAERGWIGMTWPEKYGGHGRSALERHVVVEELLAAGAPVAAHWIADRQTGPLLMRFGSEALRLELLPRIAAGGCYFSIGMSEPDSGSDLASIRTTARRTAGGWLVSGTKVWTSGAHFSHYMLSLVRTSKSDNKHEGLSQVIIDLRGPGVEVRPIKLLSGEEHFTEVVMLDAFVPDHMLVGEEGAGWGQVMAELAFERSGPERVLSTYPLLAELIRPDPDDRRAELIGRLGARLLALRHMALGVATAIERGAAPLVEASLVKDLGTRFESEVTQAARSLYDDAPQFRRLLAEAVLHGPGMTLRGGTNEILRTVVARGLVAR